MTEEFGNIDFDPMDFDLDTPSFDLENDLPDQQVINATTEKEAENNSALKELLAALDEGKLLSPEGEKVDIPKNSVSKDKAATLFYLTHVMKPILTVETGFYSGISAGMFLSAHMMNNINGGHVPIQNQANEINDGIGTYTLKRLGFQNYQLMEHEASLVMPQMLLQNLAEDLYIVFLNGSDRFDEAMLELYYMDLMVQTDGLIIFNTVDSPARQAVLDYTLKNKPYYISKEMDNGLVILQKKEDVLLGQDETYKPFKTDF